jgi:hypothetical protein
MKTTKNLFAVLFAIVLMQPLFLKAQSAPVYKPATISHPASHWDPVTLSEKGANIQNGVEFYSKSVECNLQKVDLVKLVNTNNYSVKIAFQRNAETPVEYIRIQASSSMEGLCSSSDLNLAKLVFNFPNGKTEEELKKIKQFVISSIVVSEMK